MKKRHIATAVLVILCSTTIFAAPRNEPQSPFSNALDRIVRVIKHIVQPLDDISVSPPHP
jgi:uncharacterized protein YggT (Ycf19 family)